MFWYSQAEVPALGLMGSWLWVAFIEAWVIEAVSWIWAYSLLLWCSALLQSPPAKGCICVPGVLGYILFFSGGICQIPATHPILLDVQQMSCRSHAGLLDSQKMAAEHLQINQTAQRQGMQRVWDGAELLYAARVADTGNSAPLGASGHHAWAGQLCRVCVGAVILSRCRISVQKLEFISIWKSWWFNSNCWAFAAPSHCSGNYEDVQHFGKLGWVVAWA